MEKYKIKQCEEDFAYYYWSSSETATVFNNPQVVKHLVDKIEWWLVTKDNEPFCLWPVALDNNGKITNIPFGYWFGPLWTLKGFNQKNHSSLSVKIQVYELFLSTLINKYGRIEASLHYKIMDIRVFDWWNYHAPQLPRIQIFPRYSAYIDLNIPVTELKYNYRELRRRNIKKAEKIIHNLEMESNFSPAEVCKLYEHILGFKNNKLDNLCLLVSLGFGKTFVARDKKTGELVAFLLFLHAKGVANLVLNLVHDSYRNLGLLPWMINKAILFYKDCGYSEFDFNGANSPTRGDDKHSYGAKERLYFDISYGSA